MRRIVTFLSCLALSVPSFAGARAFNGTTQYLTNATAVVTAVPNSFFCWAKSTSDTAQQAILNVADTAGNSDEFEIAVDGSSVGDPAQASARRSTTSSANTAVSYVINRWEPVGGSETSATSRAVYIRGGNKVTNATSRIPVSLDTTNIGVRKRLTPSEFFFGSIGQCAAWNVTLTDAEQADLGMGISPEYVRTASLVGYWPIFGVDTTEKNIHGTANMTLVASPTNADGPPVVYQAGGM